MAVNTTLTFFVIAENNYVDIQHKHMQARFLSFCMPEDIIL